MPQICYPPASAFGILYHLVSGFHGWPWNFIFKAFFVLKPSFKGNLPVPEWAECVCSGRHTTVLVLGGGYYSGGSREFSWLSCHMRTQGEDAIRELESHHRLWLYYTVNLEFSLQNFRIRMSVFYGLPGQSVMVDHGRPHCL